LLGGQGGGCSWGHDDVNLERHQFGRKSGEPLGLPLGSSVFDHDVAALDVPEVTQFLTESLVRMGTTGQVGHQEDYSSDLGRLLGLGGEWPGEDAQREDSDECHTSDHHAATAVCWLRTAVIFRQPSILRNVIRPE